MATSERRETLIREVHSQLDKLKDDREELMDLKCAIEKADLSLKKFSEFDYPFPYPTYSIDDIMETFQSTGTLDTNPHGVRTRQGTFHTSSRPDKYKSNKTTKSSNLPNVGEELKAQQEEFWASLVERNYVNPVDMDDGNATLEDREKMQSYLFNNSEKSGKGKVNYPTAYLSTIMESAETIHEKQVKDDFSTLISEVVKKDSKEIQVGDSLVYSSFEEDSATRESEKGRSKLHSISKQEDEAERSRSYTDIVEESLNTEEDVSESLSSRKIKHSRESSSKEERQ